MPRYPVFTPQEISVFRKAIDAYRAPGAYEPGKWSVSPLNRRPEIVGTMPGKIVLRDIAVRTTEQMPEVVLPAAERPWASTSSPARRRPMSSDTARQWRGPAPHSGGQTGGTRPHIARNGRPPTRTVSAMWWTAGHRGVGGLRGGG